MSEENQNTEHVPYEPWILDAFDVHQEHPLRKAIMFILQDAAQADSAELTKMNLTDSQRHFVAGRLATSKDLFDLINDIFTQANNRQQSPT
jgi:hypothetical protein